MIATKSINKEMNNTNNLYSFSIKIIPFIFFSIFILICNYEVSFFNEMNDNHKLSLIDVMTDFHTGFFFIFKMIFFFLSWGFLNKYLKFVKTKREINQVKYDFFDEKMHILLNKLPTIKTSKKFCSIVSILKGSIFFVFIFYVFTNSVSSLLMNETTDFNLLSNGEYTLKKEISFFFASCYFLSTLYSLFFDNRLFVENRVSVSSISLIFSGAVSCFIVFVFGGFLDEAIKEPLIILDSEKMMSFFFSFINVYFMSFSLFTICLYFLKKRTPKTKEERDLIKQKRNDELKRIEEKNRKERTLKEKFKLIDHPEHLREKDLIYATDNLYFSKVDYFSSLLSTSLLSLGLYFSVFVNVGNINILNESVISDDVVYYRDSIYIHPNNTPIVEGFIEHYFGSYFIHLENKNDLSSLTKVATNHNLHEELIRAIAINELHFFKTKEENKEHIKNYEFKNNVIGDVIKRKVSTLYTQNNDFDHIKKFYTLLIDKEYQEAADVLSEMTALIEKEKEMLGDNYSTDSTFYGNVYSHHIMVLLERTGLATIDNENERIVKKSFFDDFDTFEENNQKTDVKITIDDVNKIIDIFN